MNSWTCWGRCWVHNCFLHSSGNCHSTDSCSPSASQFQVFLPLTTAVFLWDPHHLHDQIQLLWKWEKGKWPTHSLPLTHACSFMSLKALLFQGRLPSEMMTFRIYFNCKNIFKGWLKGFFLRLYFPDGKVGSALSCYLYLSNQSQLLGRGSWSLGTGTAWVHGSPSEELEKFEWEVCWLKIVSPWLHFACCPDSSACRKSSHLLLCVLILFHNIAFSKRQNAAPSQKWLF